jgi:uncharacterized protein
MKKTLVLGASTNILRYSYKAIHQLLKNNIEVEAIGIKDGVIDGIAIKKGKPLLIDIDTVTLYLNPERQKEYYDYIIGLKPKRIIFNPGTENAELKNLAEKSGIQTEEACTLVLLSIGAY